MDRCLHEAEADVDRANDMISPLILLQVLKEERILIDIEMAAFWFCGWYYSLPQ